MTGQGDTSEWAKAGLMIKESTTAGSTYGAVMVTPDHGVRMQAQFTYDTGGTAMVPPDAWLKLTRTASIITAYRSADGVAWTEVGSRTVAMPVQVQIGLFVTAHNGDVLNTSTFTNVGVSAGEPGGLPAGLPAGWSHADIGDPVLDGTATFSGGQYTIVGPGEDMWDDTDELHYAYRPLAGDGSIVARVVSQTRTADWAKSGVIVKSAATSGSDYVALMLTPDHGVRVQAHFTADVSGGAASGSIWLKLTRVGSTVTAFRSANGVDWTLVSTQTLAGPATIGLFATAHSPAALNTSVFDMSPCRAEPEVSPCRAEPEVSPSRAKPGRRRGVRRAACPARCRRSAPPVRPVAQLSSRSAMAGLRASAGPCM